MMKPAQTTLVATAAVAFVIGLLGFLTGCQATGGFRIENVTVKADAHASADVQTDVQTQTPDATGATEAQAPKQLLVLDLDFGFNSAHLTDQDLATLSNSDTLDTICQALVTYKRLNIEGHADSRGSDSYNLRLTQRRAESVRTTLLSNKRCPINGAQLVAVGMGEKAHKCQEPPQCNGKDKGPSSCEPCWNMNRMTVISIAEDTPAAIAPAAPAAQPTGCSQVLILGQERGSRMCEQGVNP